MDYQRIDKYMENHFSDEFGDKICQLFVDGDYLVEGPNKEWDLQYLEQRIALQEDLIDAVAYEYGIINRGLAAELTERSDVVDDHIHGCYGDSFISPSGKVVDTAEYMFYMEPEIYYDIAQNIIAGAVDRIIEVLETEGECHFEYCCYKMVKKTEEENCG